MNVIRAQHAGACYGVQRALDMTYSALDRYGEINTLGPLIHNPQVVRDLQDCGAQVADEATDVTFPVVVIRSHGVVPAIRAELEQRDLTIVDATCPYVARAQKCARELAMDGCHVLVVGEAGHFEVEGIIAYAQQADESLARGSNQDKSKHPNRVDVVGSVADIPDDLQEPVGIVVQTTQMQENLDAIIHALNLKGITPVVRNTICSATTQRQKAAADLAEHVDAMVVVGGRNSSNTTRLAEICSRVCPQVYHIENATELSDYAENLSACDTVGLTAGASTPESQISKIMNVLTGFTDQA